MKQPGLPTFVKNIRQLIYWNYAKLICEARSGSRTEYALVMSEFKKLEIGQKNFSSILRDNKKFLELEKKCIYCGSEDNIQLDHIIPLSKGGPDSIDNLIYACRKCNLSKGNKHLHDWNGAGFANRMPGIVVSKFLKIIYEEHEK